MFKLESFVTPLLANYLNKYIKDLRADDLQLSLWKGEAVLNNLDLRLDAIEHDLGLPLTFVSGNIQELRIKVPWTKLTAEPVVISVNTMECVLRLTPVPGSEAASEADAQKKVDKKPTYPSTTSAAPPPQGYMESLSTRVINNVKIQFTNLILRYVEDFELTVLIKSANYFTVNDQWERSFVEVSQPDLCLRKVLVFHDLHVSLSKRAANVKEIVPLLERTFVTCRFLTKFDNTDCRVVVSSVFNVLCDELHISILDVQLPMIRRLVDFVIAYQAGCFKSRIRRDWVELESLTAEDAAEAVAEVPVSSQQNASWTAWALSFIPTTPPELDESDSVPEVTVNGTSKSNPPRASTIAAYARKLNMTFLVSEEVKSKDSTTQRRRPLVRLETENGFFIGKSREAKFSSFRAALGTCHLLSMDNCVCGENESGVQENLRTILSFSDYENPLSERSKLLNGSLFGTNDDEKEIIDSKSPFESMESYLAYNTEINLLQTFGVCVADASSIIEVPEDFAGHLPSMTESDLEYSNLKQESTFRVVISPLLLSLCSSSFHRFSYILEWFWNYPYSPYEEGLAPVSAVASLISEDVQQLANYFPMKSLQVTLLKPTCIVTSPSHSRLQNRDIRKGKPQIRTSRSPACDSPAVIFQAERFDYRQSFPVYPNRMLTALTATTGAYHDVLRSKSSLRSSMKLAGIQISLCLKGPGDVMPRNLRTLVLPTTLEQSSCSPITNSFSQQLDGPLGHTTINCPGLELRASLSELLLCHLCLSGLVRDMGNLVYRESFRRIANEVFVLDLAVGSPDVDVIRIELKLGKLNIKIAAGEDRDNKAGRLSSLEMSILIADSTGAASPILREKPESFSLGPDFKGGCMRISSYNLCFRSHLNQASQEIIYSLYLPTITKLTLYHNFIRRFIQNMGLSVQCYRDVSYADLLLDTTSALPALKAAVIPTRLRYELHHEKFALDILDSEFDYLSISVNSGIFSHIYQHLNIAAHKYEMRALLVNLGRSCRDPVLGPVSGSFEFEAFGVSQSTASFVSGDISLMPLRVGPLTVNSLTKVASELMSTYQLLEANIAESGGPKPPRKLQPEQLRVIASQDDLRSHKWQYHHVHIPGRDDCLPDVNQIQFRETDTEQTMTWRYPELRTISSAAIIPVPFLVSHNVDTKHEIICSLQYLKRPVNNFVDLRSFTLMESTECMFRFPDITPEDFDRLPISDVWRVKVNYGIQDEIMTEEATDGALAFPMSVISLAGCMKINSGIIVGVPSSLHVNLRLGVISVGLIHHVPVLAKTPGHSMISGFTYDSSYPSDQEFCRVKLDKVHLLGRLVGGDDSSKVSLEVGFWVESDFVNYRFLTVQPLIESCYFSASVSYVTEDKTFIQAKIDSKTPLVVHCGQNVVHTFSMALLAWKMAQRNSYPSLPIMNHIVICNDTCHVIRIRQYTTDECIYVKPKEMHPYSWRSQRADQKLQFSVEAFPNVWSEPCAVELGNQLCTFLSNGKQDMGLVCNIQALNNIQKQVILTTQFVIANRLNFELEVQWYTEPEYVANPLIETAQGVLSLHPSATSSTQCIHVEKIKRVRIRRKGGMWSQDFALSETSFQLIVQVPFSVGHTIDIWATLVVPASPPGSRLLVFSPIICGINHLPFALTVTFQCGDQYYQEDVKSGGYFSPQIPFLNLDYEVQLQKCNSDEEPQHLVLNLPKLIHQLGQRSSLITYADLLKESLRTRRPTSHGKVDEETSVVVATSDYSFHSERILNFTDTLMFHVKPSGVNIRNDYNVDLVLYGDDDEMVVSVGRKETAVLPSYYKGQLRIGVENAGTIFLSDYFNVRPTQTAREPMMDCNSMGMLPCGGFITVTFWEKRIDRYLIHHLTLLLKDDESVKTMLITSRYVALSSSPEDSDVLLAAFIVPKFHGKVNYPEQLKIVESVTLSSTVTPLSPFSYVVPSNHPIKLDTNRASELLIYLCTSLRRLPEPKWSYPREIKELKNKKGRVVTLSVPGVDQLQQRFCLKTSVLEDSGILYLLLEKTDAPNLVLYNNCPYPLSFGECVKKGNGIITFEEKELFTPLPVVDAGGLVQYCFPSRDEEFPTVTSSSPNYQLRIGRLIQTGSSNDVVVWSSTSVDAFTATNDRFISIPGVCYLKLNFRRHNRYTVHVTIDPLSRIGTPISPTSDNPSDALLQRSPPVSQRSTASLASPSPTDDLATALNVGVSCTLKSVIVTLDDEISNPEVIAEVLRLSVDDISVQFYCDGQTLRTYECAVNVSDLQLDNQLYSCGFFDFPVILTKENPTKNVQSALNVLCKLNPLTFSPDNIHISLAPMACFVEDSLALHLLRLVDTFLAPALLVAESEAGNRQVHHLIRAATPVILERIHIAPVDVYLSVHAALKMFVALAKTPLSFGELECNNVNSTTAEVWNFITMHYIRGTLLRAGWVIGSMDLLGNPANLLRTLTSGCNDLFIRPFSALHAGPVSFLQVLAEGASSFLANVSTGTLSSVTNLAESVSRNLDWASLDDDHILRRMEVKYGHHPDGLASGLKQGLTGFGMSLLGAVAGLVDQPMQAVMKPALTPAQLITALMLGITKGVMGAVSKPIAGAAGLVSQTGQGILRSQGLLNFPPRRFVAPPKLAASFTESTLKYIWKVAPLLPNTVRTLCVVEATPFVKDPDNNPNDVVCLFLTDIALFVIRAADDEFRQAYSLSKLNIRVTQPGNSRVQKDLLQVTLLIEADVVSERDSLNTDLEETAWPWDEAKHVPVVISPTHSWDSSNTHFTKESYLLEWKDAKLFQELFLVAKSNV